MRRSVVGCMLGAPWPLANSANLHQCTYCRLGPLAADQAYLVGPCRVYNWAVPPRSAAAEATCHVDGSCGRFLVVGWPLPPATAVPSGTIVFSSGNVPAVMAASLPLRSANHYLLVRQ